MSRDLNPTSPPLRAKVENPEADWQLTVAPLGELAQLVATACHGTDSQRREIILAILRDLIETGQANRILLAKAQLANVKPGLPFAAAVAVRGKDDSATLLAASGSTNDLTVQDSIGILKRLVDLVHDQLALEGATFVQAMRNVDDEGFLLSNCGYRRLAVLDYLCASVKCLPEASGQNVCKLAWESYESKHRWLGNEDAALAELVELVDRTYVDSLDCPDLAVYRETTAVLNGYRTAAGFEPGLWFFCRASREGTDCESSAGCLLLTKHPSGGSIEITYMGLVPEWRGSGLGKEILREAIRIALRHGFGHLTLAVDRANVPALSVYQSHGFENLMSEAIWGRKIGSQTLKKDS